MKLSSKLGAGFGSLMLIAASLGIVSNYSSNRNAQSIQNLATNQLPAIRAVLTIENAGNVIKACQRTLLSFNLDPAVRQRQQETAAKARAGYEQAARTFDALPKTPEMEAKWTETKTDWQTWSGASNEFSRMSDEFDQLAKTYNLTGRAKSMSYPDAINLVSFMAKEAQVTFKIQVQEWKDTLLRGQNPDDFKKHQEAFAKREESVQNQLAELQAILKDLGLDVSAAAKLASAHAALGTKYREALKIFSDGTANPGQMADQKVRGIDRPVTAGFDEVITATKTTASQLKDLENSLAHQGLAVCRDAQTKMETALETLVEIQTNESNNTSKSASTLSSVLQISALITTVGGIVLGAGLAWGITRSINLPIRRVTDTLSGGAGQTSSAAALVSAASQTLAQGASEQAASLEETSSSLEELASMTKRNTDTAQKVTSLAKKTRQAADTCVSDMQQMAGAMDAIKASSNEISKIVKTIDEIAFQTNILALNAAVESARAGEAGAGFAVVADEVRTLAQRSAAASKETAGKIEGAITNTMRGVEISSKVALSLNEIAINAREVDELAAEVAGASDEQSQGIEQISKAVMQMDAVTQTNASGAEESASASEELHAQAECMKEAVADLQRLVDGGGKGVLAQSAPSAGNGARIKPSAKANVIT